MSYRNRGYTLRIKINKKIRTLKKINLKLKKKREIKKEKNKIIPYSARNNKTNPAEPNSTLNPEINSLSPSLKSKGARFVSATHLRNTKGNKQKLKKTLKKKLFREFKINSKLIIKKTKQIS